MPLSVTQCQASGVVARVKPTGIGLTAAEKPVTRKRFGGLLQLPLAARRDERMDLKGLSGLVVLRAIPLATVQTHPAPPGRRLRTRRRDRRQPAARLIIVVRSLPTSRDLRLASLGYP
jgi:hypothetical protein